MKKYSHILRIILVCFVGSFSIKFFNLFIPAYFVSNDFPIETYQFINDKPDLQDQIVLVNIKDHDQELIIKQLEVIATFNPKVIGLDFFQPDSINITYDPPNLDKLVLPCIIDNNDSLRCSINYFSKNAIYGLVTLDNTNSFKPFWQIGSKNKISFPGQILKLYDSTLFMNIIERNHHKEIINYAGNVHKFIYLDDLTSVTEVQLFDIKDKIVLVGYFGTDSLNFIHNNANDEDKHLTPKGYLYGTAILANILHTMLGNYVNYLSTTWMVFIVIAYITLVVICSQFIIFKFKQGYLLIKLAQIIFIVAAYFMTVFFLSKFFILFDYQWIIHTIIISGELAFWMLYSFKKNLNLSF